MTKQQASHGPCIRHACSHHTWEHLYSGPAIVFMCTLCGKFIGTTAHKAQDTERSNSVFWAYWHPSYYDWDESYSEDELLARLAIVAVMAS